MSDNAELINLLAKKFVARPDVKAVQYKEGYFPDGKRNSDGSYSEYYPWSRQAFEDHLAGTKTYGHYLLSRDSQVKLFALDIDLEREGQYDADFGNPEISSEDPFRWDVFNPRESWRDRSHPSRPFVKAQMHELAHKLGKTIEDELEVPWAAAYTGNKGIHVYGFTGLIPGDDARDGASIVLETLGFGLIRGKNFFKHDKYQNFSVEIFPKQGSLDGKDLGNLMRLPLGRNLKAPHEPTFFLDMTAPMGQLTPLDPVFALTTSSQWKQPGE